jgi:hypothetical protein
MGTTLVREIFPIGSGAGHFERLANDILVRCSKLRAALAQQVVRSVCQIWFGSGKFMEEKRALEKHCRDDPGHVSRVAHAQQLTRKAMTVGGDTQDPTWRMYACTRRLVLRWEEIPVAYAKKAPKNPWVAYVTNSNDDEEHLHRDPDISATLVRSSTPRTLRTEFNKPTMPLAHVLVAPPRPCVDLHIRTV